MYNQNVKKFIRDYENNSKFFNKKSLFKNYFLRGNFKKGFTLLLSNDFNEEDYYFKLDSEDITNLINKYKVVYENILSQEKEEEIELTKIAIENLNEKLKNLSNKQ